MFNGVILLLFVALVIVVVIVVVIVMVIVMVIVVVVDVLPLPVLRLLRQYRGSRKSDFGGESPKSADSRAQVSNE